MRAAVAVIAFLSTCAPAPDADPDVAWSLEDGASRVTLIAADAEGPILAMTCVQATRGFVVQAIRMEPVASDGEFSFGTADGTMLLVADPDAGATGVIARGEMFEPALNSMLSGAPILGLYGGQRLGPLTAPAGVAGAFTGACVAPSPARLRGIGPESVTPAPQDGATAIQAGRSGAFAE